MMCRKSWKDKYFTFSIKEAVAFLLKGTIPPTGENVLIFEYEIKFEHESSIVAIPLSISDSEYEDFKNELARGMEEEGYSNNYIENFIKKYRQTPYQQEDPILIDYVSKRLNELSFSNEMTIASFKGYVDQATWLCAILSDSKLCDKAEKFKKYLSKEGNIRLETIQYHTTETILSIDSFGRQIKTINSMIAYFSSKFLDTTFNVVSLTDDDIDNMIEFGKVLCKTFDENKHKIIKAADFDLTEIMPITDEPPVITMAESDLTEIIPITDKQANKYYIVFISVVVFVFARVICKLIVS